MHDKSAPWRIDDLVYLEREINYWTGPKGYATCTAAIQETRALAASHAMNRVAVLPAWAARYEGVLRDVVVQIDPAGVVVDCNGAEIVIMPTPDGLGQFVAWCERHVQWDHTRP